MLRGIAVAAVIAAVGSAPAFATCVRPNEEAALTARILQTELMVAALACGQQSQYNAFVIKFRDDLVSHGHALKSLFKRVHGAQADRRLATFVTRLANDASVKSREVANFCSEAFTFFTTAMETASADLEKLAETHNASVDHGFAVCTAELISSRTAVSE
ncbi:MAG: hypothetical protein EXQ86_10510 [Rhodospirillales bacterium]|nr:hypothetical protein [Rhodospirillales bacterium]